MVTAWLIFLAFTGALLVILGFALLLSAG